MFLRISTVATCRDVDPQKCIALTWCRKFAAWFLQTQTCDAPEAKADVTWVFDHIYIYISYHSDRWYVNWRFFDWISTGQLVEIFIRAPRHMLHIAPFCRGRLRQRNGRRSDCCVVSDFFAVDKHCNRWRCHIILTRILMNHDEPLWLQVVKLAWFPCTQSNRKKSLFVGFELRAILESRVLCQPNHNWIEA